MKKFQKSLAFLALVVILAAGCDTSFAQPADAKTNKVGLLIMTHGAPSPQWNTDVQKFAEQVKKLNGEKNSFHSIAAVNLEFNSPSPAEGVADLEKAGCERIIVVPVFVMPGSHTIRDVPAVMGVYFSPSIKEKMMSDESLLGHDHAHSHDHSGCILHQAVRTKLPITITHTMEEGGFLEQYVLDEIAALSQNQAEESVLFLVHGDAGYVGVIEPLMQHLADEAVKEEKVAAAEWAYCRVGQSYVQNAVPAIKRLAETTKRVLVIGLYVASSAKDIHQRATSRDTEQKQPLFGNNIRFSEANILAHPRAATWVLQSAENAL